MALTKSSTGGPPTAPGSFSSESRATVTFRKSGLPDGRLIAKPETNGWPSAIATISRKMPASRVGLSLRISGTRGSSWASRASNASIRGSSSKKSRSAAEFGQLRFSAM